MRSRLFFGVVLLASVAFAAEPKPYLRGKLLQMESVACGAGEIDNTKVAGSGHEQAHETLCQEYVLQTEYVNYHIRPRNEKHPTLLPVGELAQFRLQKDKMLLRVDDPGIKEQEYIVVSMTPRADSSAADARTPHLNHLQ